MNTFLRNTISKLHNTVAPPVTAIWDALAKRLQSIRDTASLLYNRMMENMGYGRERLKDIVEKEAEEEKAAACKEEEAKKQRQGPTALLAPEYLKTQKSWNDAVRSNPCILRYVPDFFKTQEMYERAVEKDPQQLKDVPDHFKMEKMCERAIEKNSWCLKYVSGHLQVEKMCIKSIKKEAEALELVLDQFKTGEMCKRAIETDLYTLVFCPDWFVTQEQIKSWYDGDYDDETPEWYEGYQKRKAPKAKIKEELLPIAWHPSRWWDWCIPEDEKKK